MNCPSCGRPVESTAVDCTRCGIILSKWKSPARRPPAPSPRVATRPKTNLLRALLLGVAGGSLVVAAYWFTTIDPPFARLERADAAPSSISSIALPESGTTFDRALPVDASHLGIAWDGKSFVLTNRRDPWGFIRVTPGDGDSFTFQKIVVPDPVYGQKSSFNAVTWNGTHFVAYTDGTWLQSKWKNVFTMHDRESLRIVDHVEAPELLGCLAWTGKEYWAATRRNRRDADEAAWLYRIGADMKTIERFPMETSVGCQGMAWDGHYLWMTDVFDGTINIVDVSGNRPRIIHRQSTSAAYLSGAGFDGTDIWIAEYGENTLRRLVPRLRLAWSRNPGVPAPADAAAPSPPVTVAAIAPVPSAGTTDADRVAELRRQLRADHWSDRMSAEHALRRLGIAIDYDREQTTLPDLGADEMDLIDLEAEIRDGTITASWELWFGERLFSSQKQSKGNIVSIPLFVRYTVSVEGEGKDIEKEYEARPGRNVMRDIVVASDLLPGKYSVSVFLHAQYVRDDGTPQIDNRSTIGVTVER